MAFVSVYLGLGSNQGNRLQNLTQALDLLDAALGCHYTALSRIIETKAWGFKGDKFNTTPTVGGYTTTGPSTSISFSMARNGSTARTCRSRIRSSRSAIS